MKSSLISSHSWIPLIVLALASGCCAAANDASPVSAAPPTQNSADEAEHVFVHALAQDTDPQAPDDEQVEPQPASETEQASATEDPSSDETGSAAGNAANLEATEEKLPNAEQAFQNALDALQQAAQAVDTADDANAMTALRKAVEALQSARGASESESGAKNCCKTYAPRNCPVKPCTEAGDACVIVRLPSIESRNPSFTSGGVFAFSELFSAATARGIENATIRAMNATKVCPIPPCDPQEEAENAQEASSD